MRKKYVLLLIIGVFLLFYSSMSFSKEEKGSYVGAETCKGCHTDKYDTYAGSIHAKKAISGSPANRNQCESCHGAGDAHVSKGGGRGTGMMAFSKKRRCKG